MLFINQREHPEIPYRTRTSWKNDTYGQTSTIATSGCGLCCSVMVLDRLFPDRDYTFSIEDAVALSYETGANYGTGTSGILYFPAFAEKFGLRYAQTNALAEAAACLREGGAVIALVGQRDDEGHVGVFTKKEHYICLVSVLADGRFAVLDPYLYDGKFEEPGRAGKVELHGNLVLSPPEVLESDTLKIVRRTENVTDKPVTKAYSLFWRF